MADLKQLPQLVVELLDMSKQYLREATIEPAKRLGSYAGKALAGGALLAIGAALAVVAIFSVFRQWVLPDGEWWSILARVIAVAFSVLGIFLVVWRLNKDG